MELLKAVGLTVAAGLNTSAGGLFASYGSQNGVLHVANGPLSFMRWPALSAAFGALTFAEIYLDKTERFHRIAQRVQIPLSMLVGGVVYSAAVSPLSPYSAGVLGAGLAGSIHGTRMWVRSRLPGPILRRCASLVEDGIALTVGFTAVHLPFLVPIVLAAWCLLALGIALGVWKLIVRPAWNGPLALVRASALRILDEIARPVRARSEAMAGRDAATTHSPPETSLIRANRAATSRMPTDEWRAP